MKNTFIGLVLVGLLTFMFASCGRDYSEAFNKAYSIVDSMPDSSLCLLGKLNVKDMSSKDKAKYALLYTMAQDKSGLDVDDDSLIRIAYNWYSLHKEDTLYAKCMNYMGTYYMLNDSIEQAVFTLKESAASSHKSGDFDTESMALEKLSKVMRDVDDKKSLDYSKQAFETYERLEHPKLSNRIYVLLNLSEAYAFCNDNRKAIELTQKALKLALCLQDTLVLSHVCQDMALFYSMGLEAKDSTLCYAKKAFQLTSDKTDVSCQAMLATAYIENDSLFQAKQLIDGIVVNNDWDRYVLYNLKEQYYIRKGDLAEIENYSDSAQDCIGNMYDKAQSMKVSYFSSIISQEKEKAYLEGKGKFQSWLIFVIGFLALFVIGFVLYVYFSYRKFAAKRLAFQKEREAWHLRYKQDLYEKDKMHLREMHEQEIEHKEALISAMRNYLMKSITVVDKIRKLSPESQRHFVLSDKDWGEIEAFLNNSEDRFMARFKKQHPGLSNKDLQLVMLLRLQIPQKVLASLYGISEKAVKQKLFLYKTKVGINGQKLSLREYIEKF